MLMSFGFCLIVRAAKNVCDVNVIYSFLMHSVISCIYREPVDISLAIPPRVGKMITGDDYGHRQGRNGEFCVTVGPVTRTADLLTQSVIWRTWAVC